jgi:hypothetical protein
MQKKDLFISEKSNNGAFDIVKFVACILVVCIHTNPFPNYFQPLYRIAVPFFYMISSFLFFTRVRSLDKGEHRQYILKYIKRSLILYLFYFIVLFPSSYVFFYRSWWNLGFPDNILRFIEQFFLSYTFAIPSWYIVSSILGIIIIYYAIRYKSKYIMLVISVTLYIICCLTSNYECLLPPDFELDVFAGGGIFKPQNSFLVSLIWIYFGYVLTVKKYTFTKFVVFILLAALFFEYGFIIHALGVPESQDCYILLPPLCFILFTFILRWNITYKNGLMMRKMSTIIFCVHHPIATIGKIILLHNGIEHGILNFTITITLSFLICLVIFELEKRKFFSWLKYSY